MSIEAMKRALEALTNTDTHPISSAEQYFKEIQAMEALEDAINDAQEREWVGLTDEDYKALEVEVLANNMSYREVLKWADKRLKEKNHG